jgi:hypothetical protein
MIEGSCEGTKDAGTCRKLTDGSKNPPVASEFQHETDIGQSESIWCPLMLYPNMLAIV